MLAGIDLGGTQVRVALARSDGRLIASFKTKTPLLRTPERMVEWAAEEIERHRRREKVTSITIAAPGPIDIKKGVLVNPPNLPGWRNVPLADLLRRATGARVHVANDADMAGLGEFHRGAGQGTRNMVYITWSTGVGGGLIIDGKLHRGAHGKDDELVHATLVFRRHPIVGVEQPGGTVAPRHLRGNPRGQVRNVEGLDRANPRFARQEAGPDIFEPDAERAHQAHAGDDDAPHRGAFPEWSRRRGRWTGPRRARRVGMRCTFSYAPR